MSFSVLAPEKRILRFDNAVITALTTLERFNWHPF
jgi:hypothetical protein